MTSKRRERSAEHRGNAKPDDFLFGRGGGTGTFAWLILFSLHGEPSVECSQHETAI
jgi:hypothetical protein